MPYSVVKTKKGGGGYALKNKETGTVGKHGVLASAAAAKRQAQAIAMSEGRAAGKQGIPPPRPSPRKK